MKTKTESERRAALAKRVREAMAVAQAPDVAFVHPLGGSRGLREKDAEAVAEEFLAQATSAEDVGEAARDELLAEEIGGPFVEVEIRPELAVWASDDDETVEAR